MELGIQKSYFKYQTKSPFNGVLLIEGTVRVIGFVRVLSLFFSTFISALSLPPDLIVGDTSDGYIEQSAETSGHGVRM